MTKFNQLTPYLQKEILDDVLLHNLPVSEIEEKYGVAHEDIADMLKTRVVNPFNEFYNPDRLNQDRTHKRTILNWVKGFLAASGISYLLVVLLQSFLGGFESQIVTDSIAYITQPLAKIVNLGLALSFIILCLYLLFPILAVFINEKVNTVSLKDTFLKSPPQSKLNFLAIIVLALCLLTGLVFSAKGQTNPRACLIETAYSEVGVLETGGNNKGARIDQYRSVSLSKNVKGYSDPWCAYFVSFVYRTCKIPYKVTYSPRAREWFQDSKKIVWRRNFQYSVIAKKPRPGDLIGYMFNSGTIGHIEVLYDWKPESGYFVAIGGNTSNSGSVLRDANSQDGVRLKKRKIETAYIIANHVDI